MKSTGIVRKIDNLGRIVIPKEIRDRLNIDDNENIEIFIEENKIILKKYNLLSEIYEYIRNIGNAVSSIASNNVIITDKEKIIYSNKVDYADKKISRDLKDLIRRDIKYVEDTSFEITDNLFIDTYSILSMIKFGGNNIGIIIMYSKTPLNSDDKNIILYTSKIISEFYN